MIFFDIFEKTLKKHNFSIDFNLLLFNVLQKILKIF